MSFFRSTKDCWRRRIFPFKTLFELSRYDFRFPRYPRIKRRVIFNRLLSSSLLSYSKVSLAPRFADLSQTADERQTRFLEKRGTRFLEKNVGRGFIHYPRRLVLSTRKTLNCYNSASNEDIGIKQKAISTVSLPLLSVQFLIAKFLLSRKFEFSFSNFTRCDTTFSMYIST